MVARIYEKAGDTWSVLGRYSQALEDYNLAKKYAYNKKIIGRIERKMNKIYEKYKEKRPKLRKLKIAGLEKRLTFGVLSIMSLAISLFFISVSLTGYIINLNFKEVFPIEILLFFFGLVFAFLYFREKKKEK